jgi:hypothetical protein
MTSELFLNDFGTTTVRDFGFLFCGRKLGQGRDREVFELLTDPSKVVKIETGARSFQNVIEWETWQALEDTRHARWLAPCRFISPSGIVLIMDRTSPLREREEPRTLPGWLVDTKRDNYGVIEGRVVCHDYGLPRLLDRVPGASKHRRVEWWG